MKGEAIIPIKEFNRLNKLNEENIKLLENNDKLLEIINTNKIKFKLHSEEINEFMTMNKKIFTTLVVSTNEIERIIRNQNSLDAYLSNGMPVEYRVLIKEKI